jgi:DinB superfamily
MTVEWNRQLVDQLDWHWAHQLRPRLTGLGDDEYFWEPVAGCWNVRPRDESTAPIAFGSGGFVVDSAYPEPVPPPVTTIAWRIAHLVVDVLGMRASAHFSGPPVDHQSFAYAGNARKALGQLEEAYAVWIEGVRALDDDGLEKPCGLAQGVDADPPLAALVLRSTARPSTTAPRSPCCATYTCAGPDDDCSSCEAR